METMMFVVLGAGLSIGLGAIGSAIGEGYIAMNAMQALGRQPGASQKFSINDYWSGNNRNRRYFCIGHGFGFVIWNRWDAL